MDAKELRIGNYVTGAKGAKYNGDTVKWNIGDYIECTKPLLCINRRRVSIK